jgi:hypothetical protein
MAYNKRKFTEKEETLTDALTGEVLSSKKSSSTFSVDSEPPYIKLYLDCIASLHGLTSTSNDVLKCLLENMTYQNEVILNSVIKNRMAERLGISTRQIDNNLTQLKKADIIRVVGRGVFMFNPEIFARGKWPETKEARTKYKAIKMTAYIEGKGKVKIESELIPNDSVAKNAE